MLRYLEAFFRNRWLITIPAALLFLSGTGLVFVFPKEYEASSTIWTETSAYFDDPMGFNRYLTPAQIQTNRLAEPIRTYPFTRAIVNRTPVGPIGTEDQKLEFVDTIQNNLFINAEGEHLVRINFSHVEPDVALAVVQQSIDQYNEVIAQQTSAQANEAIAFYKERVVSYETNVIPRSANAVTSYLDKHPEVRRAIIEGGLIDPIFELLQQQADLDRQQYESYKQRLEQVLTQSEAARETQENAFRIMDPPWLANAGAPIISKKQILLYSIFGAGLSFGYTAIFLALATELNRTLRSAGDVRRRLHIPVLDVVPDYAASSDGRTKRTRRRQLKHPLWAPKPTAGQASHNI